MYCIIYTLYSVLESCSSSKSAEATAGRRGSEFDLRLEPASTVFALAEGASEALADEMEARTRIAAVPLGTAFYRALIAP